MLSCSDLPQLAGAAIIFIMATEPRIYRLSVVVGELRDAPDATDPTGVRIAIDSGVTACELVDIELCSTAWDQAGSRAARNNGGRDGWRSWRVEARRYRGAPKVENGGHTKAISQPASIQCIV